MIDIDGSKKEGGGSILRIASALSCITQKECHIFNIRKERDKPGLKNQHLFGLRALKELCNGKLENASIGSEEISFSPGKIKSKDITVRVKTAASITLMLQSLIPPALFASGPTKITFKGGATDTFFSPPVGYFQNVFLKIIKKANVKLKANILKKGYYPEGGAEVEVEIFPSNIKPSNLTERGEIREINVKSGASKKLKDKKVAERQVAGTREILKKTNIPVNEKVEYHSTSCPGSQICLTAVFENTILGSCNLGKLGKRAEKVGEEAALELLKESRSEACLDKYMGDQILPYMALSLEKSKVTTSEITEHCKTNAWVIEKFLKGEFKIEKNSITWIA